MKYYLLEHGHSDKENALHAFDTAPERDAATIKAIFGEDISTQDEAEQWDAYRTELNDHGCVMFEGDPGLEWFTATPTESAGPHFIIVGYNSNRTPCAALTVYAASAGLDTVRANAVGMLHDAGFPQVKTADAIGWPTA